MWSEITGAAVFEIGFNRKNRLEFGPYVRKKCEPPDFRPHIGLYETVD